MARTTQMSLIELMTLSEDISNVVEYLGRKGSFQFQSKKHDFSADKGVKSVSNPDRDFLDNLQKARIFLNIDDLDSDVLVCARANDKEDRKSVVRGRV